MRVHRGIKKVSLHATALLLFMMVFAIGVFAQQSPTPSASPEPPPPSPESKPSPDSKPLLKPKPSSSPSLERQFFKNILRDQRALWLSPFRMGGEDARWVAPLSVATAALLVTDRRTTREIREYHDQIPISINISRLGTSTGYVAAAFYFIGRARGNARAKETGILGGQAVLDSLIVSLSIKGVTQRPRPLSDGGRGRFFTGGNSFPSGHAMSVWALATVVANEYSDRRLVKIVAYGLATAASTARYTGNRHFLSEVLVGSAIGYGIGRYVYRTHHKPSIDLGEGFTQTKEQSKLFPLITPLYNVRMRDYGVSLVWNF